MGEVIVGYGVHFVMCIAYLGLLLCGEVWSGVVQFGMAWVSRGYCGAGRERRTEVYGGSRGRLGLRPLECQSCHKTETVHRLSISEEDHIGE